MGRPQLFLGQARNQEFFRAGVFFWNLGILINKHAQQDFPAGKNLRVFSWKILKIAF